MEKEASEGRLDDDQVPPMVRRSDTIAYALHAEVAHFHNERQRDFKKAMTSFLTEQINFYQKVRHWIQLCIPSFCFPSPLFIYLFALNFVDVLVLTTIGIVAGTFYK